MKGILLIATFFTYSTTISNAEGNGDILPNFSLNADDANKNLTLVEKWYSFEKSIKAIADAAVKMALPVFMDNSAKLNLSKECMKNSMHLLSGLKNIRTWALRFIDSSAKMIDGLLDGTTASFGAYDECVDTEVKSTKLWDEGKVLFRGQYCMIDMVPPLPPKPRYYKLDEVLDELKNFSQRDSAIAEAAKFAHTFYFLNLRIGVCIPSGCSLQDMNNVAQLLGNALSINVTASRCELKEENNFTPLIITVITCYSFAGFLMFVGSLIDLYAYYKKILFKNTFIRVLVSFSLFSNFRKLTNTKTASDRLSCLNGIRFLCMSWVILGHTYFFVNLQVLHGLMKLRDIGSDFAFQVLANASFAVDTFFFVGGLLVCYLTIKLVRIQGHKFNVLLYIFHRLWRILPVYVFVIMFVFLSDLFGSGPVWHDTLHKHVKACYDNWWTNLIFINNFYDTQHMCVVHSWYISSDFQMYVGALIILLPMIRWPKVGILMSVLAVMASIIYTGVGTYVNDYPPTMLVTHPDRTQLVDYWAYFYFRPFVHVSPYCIGLLSGYLLATKPDLKIPPLVQVLGWSIAFISCFSTLYGAYEWNKGAEPSFWAAILYASFNRTAWSVGVAWMVICCATGHGGVINHILSWKVFVPLGRLTFIAYLSHPLIQMTAYGYFRTRVQADHFLAVWIFLGHLCVTYAISFAGSMLIEAPLISVEKIFLLREKNADNIALVQENINLNGGIKSEKNGDIRAIVPKTDEESGGIDNTYAVYKL